MVHGVKEDIGKAAFYEMLSWIGLLPDLHWRRGERNVEIYYNPEPITAKFSTLRAISFALLRFATTALTPLG